MKRFLDGLSEVLRNVSAIVLIGIVSMVVIQIVARSILHASTPWTEEFAKYLAIWLTFLGSPVVLYDNGHLMVDLFYAKFPAKVRQWVHLFNDVFILAFCLYLFFYGVNLCTLPTILKMKSPSAQIPRVWIYAAMPVGSFLLGLYDGYDIFKTIQIIRGKIEDDTANNLIDEGLTLAEIDKKREEEAAK